MIGIFTFMFIITGAVEFHQRGVERIEKAKERGIWKGYTPSLRYLIIGGRERRLTLTTFSIVGEGRH